MRNKKYELTTETIIYAGMILHRIRALVAIDSIGVSAGDLGGYVESENNLEQSGDAWVSGNARVYGDARVSDDARVYGEKHYFSAGPIGSENGTLTVFRTRNGISVNRDCFSGTLDEFEAAVESTHGDNQHGREYRLLIELARLRAAEWHKEGE